MPLNTELLLTIQQLKGFGTKTILGIAESINEEINTINKLCQYWKTLKGKKYENIDSTDLEDANRAALRIIERSQDEGIGIISYYEAKFPEILRHCINEEGKEDPPVILYYRGNIEALTKHGIAVIGTREPTPNGEKAGIYFSKEFASRGFNIVSGLAIGCDTTGHKGALEAGGITTAFLANGLDWNSMYPKENLSLAKKIVENNGLLLSEYPIGQGCNRYSLVARDRLQAGLSYATIAIQTGIRGGTMHAVNTTLKARKPLFMISYKNDEDLKHDKVQGNIKLIEDRRANPLRADSIEGAVSIIEESIKNHSRPKIKPLL